MADIHEKYIDLMNRSLDGELSPREQTELEEYLDVNPDARAEFSRLRMAVRKMQGIPTAEPPAGLKRSVMGAIGRSRYREESRSGVIDRVANLLRHRIQWRYAYTFSAGVIIGIFILAVAVRLPESSSTVRPEEVSGTISRPDTKAMTLTDEKSFEYGNTRGTVAIHEGEQAILLKIDVQTVDEITIDIVFDDADLSPVAIWQPAPYQGRIAMAQDGVRLYLNRGTSFDITFKDFMPTTSNIICRVSSGGLEHETVMTTGVKH